MYVLGISSFYHDSAAVLIKDGKVVAAFEEERFTRIKHDNAFPKQAINFCLKTAGITIKEITSIAYYEKPLLKFERILETFVATFPFSTQPFTTTIPEWLSHKIQVEKNIRKLNFKKNIYFIPHHLSHAASSYYSSGFANAAILTVDGIGEYQTTGLWLGKKNTITPLKEINFPHSLGLLYSTFTAFLGFRVNEDEYKVMGLGAYGNPVYKDAIYKLIEIKEDGSFKLDLNYFRFREEFKMWSDKFEDLFGKPRSQNDSVLKHHKDLAASIQMVTEEIYFKMLNHLHRLTKAQNLCVSGGVGLNALANGKIFNNTPFKKIYIMGAAGDSGSAMGAALFAYFSISNPKKKVQKLDNLYLGSEFSNEEIGSYLKKNNLKFRKIESERELIKISARLLSKNAILGWFQGKMEFGPRALGNRSILANPKPKVMKEKVNRIKIRELFRPFAGSILQEYVSEYFEVPTTQKDFPFMNFCFQVKEEMRKNISAIVHADYSCRIQTVSKNNDRYYQLIHEFYKETGVPVILNTSFNLKGEPIVETPEQAIRDFLKTKIDYLVIDNYIVSK